jgi:hypothetical protein
MQKSINFLSIFVLTLCLIAFLADNNHCAVKKKSKTYSFSIVDNTGNQSYKNVYFDWNWKLKDAQTYILTLNMANRSQSSLISFKLSLYTTIAGEAKELWDSKQFYVPSGKTDKFEISDLKNVEYDAVSIKISLYKEEEQQ